MKVPTYYEGIYVSVLSERQITFYNSFFILAPTALFGPVGCCLSEGWMNGRMEGRWKVNLFSLSNHVPHFRLSNQRLLWKQPLSRVNGSIYLSFTLRSSHWGYSPFFLPSLWGSALTLSNVLQVKVTMPSLVSAFRLMTLAFLCFFMLSWEAHPPHHSCPCSLSYRIRDGEEIWVSWTLIL